MSEDVASLQIRIKSLEAVEADKRLKSLENQGKRTEKATDGLTGAFKRLAGPLLAVGTATAALTKLVNTAREFEVLNAQLITATGSAEQAAVAFEAIQDFASNTPYDLQQVTTAFTKLVNLGLEPSERALTSYGDTASAMGKDLDQLIEAVADAATGEFERLKEFGIRASSQGDQVAFTFRGVTTTVKKNSEEIQKYLIGLGENNFAGAMAQRMDTLDGALSNLGDEWDKLWRNISDQGVGDVIEDTVRTAIDALSELNAMLESGELAGYLQAFSMGFQRWGDDAVESLGIISDALARAYPAWKDDAGTAADGMTAAFKYFPENVRAFIQTLTVDIAAAFDRWGVDIEEFVDKSKAIFTDDTWEEAGKRADKEREAIFKIRDEMISDILAQRDADIAAKDAQIEASKKLREEFEKEREARKAAQGDRLAQFDVGTKQDGPTEAEKKAAQKLSEQRKKEFDKVVEGLKEEEQKIQESYDRRLAIILRNTEEGSKQQRDLKQKLDKQFATDALGEFAAPDTFQEEIDRLQEHYEARRELILNNSQLTEEMRTELEEQLTEERNQRIQALEDARTSMILASSSDLFGSLSDLAKTFGGEQSTAYKALFAVSKAFAIADSLLKIQQGIANAASLPFPGNLGAMATVASQTAGIVSNLQSISFSGAYDRGGMIPAGSVGLVGELGPELVRGPAMVTGRLQTAATMQHGAADGTSGNNFTIGQINFPNVRNESDARRAAGAFQREMTHYMQNAARYA